MKSTRWMQTLVGIAALAIAAVAVAACGGGGSDGGSSGGGSDEDAVRAFMQKELNAYRKQDWKAYYNLTSPGYRDACPYDEVAEEFEASMDAEVEDIGADDHSKIDYTDMLISIEGDTAKVAFNLREGDRVLDTIDNFDPMLVFKVENKWYLTSDTEGCDDPEASGSGKDATQAPATRQPVTRAASPTPARTATPRAGTPTRASAPPAAAGATATSVAQQAAEKAELDALIALGYVLDAPGSSIVSTDGPEPYYRLRSTLKAGDVQGGQILCAAAARAVYLGSAVYRSEVKLLVVFSARDETARPQMVELARCANVAPAR